jgi:hypothetical protein
VPSMNRRFRGTVLVVAVQLVFIAAFLHVALGLWNWLRWLEAGFLVPQDLRWPVFVGSGLVILYGIYRFFHAETRERYYLAGIVVMLGYAGGYFGWHLIGHPRWLDPSTWLVTEQVGLEWFLDHLFAGPAEFFAVTVETVAAGLLAVLYVTEADDGQASQAGADEGVPEQSVGGDRS